MACDSSSSSNTSEGQTQMVSEADYVPLNLFTHRYYTTDQEIFDRFGKQYHIKVNVFQASSQEILDSLQKQGEDRTVDMIILENTGLLEQAHQLGLTQAFASAETDENVPKKYRDAQSFWIGLDRDIRCIAYNKELVKEGELSQWADLTSKKWRGKLALAGQQEQSKNAMMLATVMANQGSSAANKLAEGLLRNAEDSLYTNEYEVFKAIAKGEKTVGLLNASSWVQISKNGNPENFEMGEKIGLAFPVNDQGRSFSLVGGAAIVNGSENWQMALKLIEFLTNEQNQNAFCEANRAYPVNPMALPGDFLISIGGFREADLSQDNIADQYSKALELLESTDWK